MLPKLSRVLKIEGLNIESRRRSPDEQTRGGHARKLVAFGYAFAAKTRQFSRFRGNIEAAGDAFSWESWTWTLHLISPINTPTKQQRRAALEAQA